MMKFVHEIRLNTIECFKADGIVKFNVVGISNIKVAGISDLKQLVFSKWSYWIFVG